MKNLVGLVNTTGTTITRFGVDFEPASPVIVYRNKNFLSIDSDFGLIINDISEGFLLGYTFNGGWNTPAETLETINAYANEANAVDDESWKAENCRLLLFGLRKLILNFDFSGTGVTKTKAQTLVKLSVTANFLSAGLLDFAIEMINTVSPDTDDDFLSSARLASFKALLNSANS